MILLLLLILALQLCWGCWQYERGQTEGARRILDQWERHQTKTKKRDAA